MFLVRLIVLPFKMGAKSTGFATRTGYRAGRLLGYRRMAVFGVGIAVGLLIAPTPGRQLRERISNAVRTRLHGLPDEELAERVRFELGHSPRTWHLPQPEVEARQGTIVLSGSVPHETGRGELERAALAVAGVNAVENLVAVTGTGATA